MARRKFREQKSKFQGSKQVLQDLNQPAHAVVHDLDVSLAGAGGASGYVLFWSSNTFIRTGDISQPIFVPEAGTLALVYASLPLPAENDAVFDVYKNGVSIFALTDRPTIFAGEMGSADFPPTNTTLLLARDVLEVEVADPGNNPGKAIVYIIVT